MIKRLLKRYSFFIGVLGITLIITALNRSMGLNSFKRAGDSFLQMLEVLPPVMLLLGLMDVWIPREKMMKFMGNNSGALGVILAILIGSVAAGPMYAAFPFVLVLLRKGVKFSNIIIFMNAWCVTKITTLMFELSALGYQFTLLRLLINLPGIIIMGYIVEWMMPKDELNELYINSNIDKK